MRSVDARERIARLRQEIQALEIEAANLEAELIDLRRTLADFSARYDRVVRPLAARVQAAREAIAQLEQQRRASEGGQGHASEPYTAWLGGDHIPVEEQYRRVWQRSPESDRGSSPVMSSSWQPDADYVPVEEQFRRAWSRTTNDETPPLDSEWWQEQPENIVTGDLRQIYRVLVRRYHPDLTADPDERRRRNHIMTEINLAYADRNAAALHALASKGTARSLQDSLAAFEWRQLRQIQAQLLSRTARLRSEYATLYNSDMMWNKIQETLAARESRDFLQELVAGLEHEYTGLLRRLDELRGE